MIMFHCYLLIKLVWLYTLYWRWSCYKFLTLCIRQVISVMGVVLRGFAWSCCRLICRAHSFTWAAEFRAKLQNLSFAMEFPHFCGIS